MHRRNYGGKNRSFEGCRFEVVCLGSDTPAVRNGGRASAIHGGNSKQQTPAQLVPGLHTQGSDRASFGEMLRCAEEERNLGWGESEVPWGIKDENGV